MSRFFTLSAVMASVLMATAAPAQAANDWTTVSAGNIHSCGIRAKLLYCWGNDANEELGTPDTKNRITPKQITAATDWTQVSSGFNYTCAIRSTGKLYCWGQNNAGQVGTGAATSPVKLPTQITAATDWIAVSTGGSHTCGVRKVGKLYCWGSDGNGQVGDGPAGGPVYSPKQITAATDWKAVGVGFSHSCAIRSTGKLYCWGLNNEGQLGTGTKGSGTDQTAPKQITTATDWKAVSPGYLHTCALRIGKVYCWGDNSSAQIGNGDTSGTDVSYPTQITTATDWKNVRPGSLSVHTCAVRSVGKLYCWGFNGSGQILPGPTYYRTPKQITAATDWSIPSAGGGHSCAIRAGGKLYCWGYNFYGQLGLGNTAVNNYPTQVTSTSGQPAP